VLNDCLRFRAIAIEIGEADPVDAGRMAADPTTPDQPRGVEEQ
jgi:hypothetical protein